MRWKIFVRRASFFCGFLIYIIAKEFGVSIPNILADSLFIVQPLSFWMVFRAIFSGFVGIGVAWVTIKVMEKNDNVAIRVAILLTTLVSCLFVDLYTSAFHAPPRYGL